jgi:hypothetical protein
MEMVRITQPTCPPFYNSFKTIKRTSLAASALLAWIHGKKRSHPKLQIRSDALFLWTGHMTRVALSKLFVGKTPGSLFPSKECTDTFPLFWAQLASD